MYDVPSTTCLMPAARIRDSMCSRNGTPAVGNIGFGADNVNGRSRVPCPPTSTTASTSAAIHLLLCCYPTRWCTSTNPTAGANRSAVGSGRGGDGDDVLAVRRLRQRLSQRHALVGIDETGDQRDLLQAGDAHTLPVLQHLHELAGLQQ